MIQQFKIDLKTKFPIDLVDALIDAYIGIKENFIINKWEPSELNGGKFVEATIRLLQNECFGTYTPIGTSIRNTFNELKRCEQSPTTIHDSFRLHIPRCLGSIYNIRNRRGVGHLGGDINANKIDALLIITTVEWVLAELYRTCYTSSLEEAQILVNNLVSRKLELIFELNGRKRVLSSKISLKDKVLVLLYSYDSKNLSVDNLILDLKYKNKTYLKTQLLTKLEKDYFIEVDSDQIIHLLPPGIRYIEANYENMLTKI
jgi:hypothetical protein